MESSNQWWQTAKKWLHHDQFTCRVFTLNDIWNHMKYFVFLHRGYLKKPALSDDTQHCYHELMTKCRRCDSKSGQMFVGAERNSGWRETTGRNLHHLLHWSESAGLAMQKRVRREGLFMPHKPAIRMSVRTFAHSIVNWQKKVNGKKTIRGNKIIKD